MGLKRERIDVSEENRILSGLITSTPLLQRLAGVIQARAFESGFARTICTWVLEYHKVTAQAPGAALMDVYAKKKGEIRDEDEADLVTEFLANLSRDWAAAEPANVQYMEKAATEYFKLRSLAHLKEQLENAVTDKNFALGEKLVADYRRVDTATTAPVDLFRETSPIAQAFADEADVLFRFRGAVGRVVGEIRRGDFVAFMGPPKRGKTWWLMHAAITAAMAGRKTLFLSYEMMQDQTIRRMWTSLTGKPKELPEETLNLPTFEMRGDRWELVDTPWECSRALDLRDSGIAKEQKSLLAMTRNLGSLRVATYPTGAHSCKDLRALLNSLELYENWVPEVVVADYADIARSDGGEKDERHRLNSIWQAYRGLAQEKGIALFTASQSGRTTMKGKDAKEFDIGEDMRKVAHVTKLITINAKDAEKEKGIYRIACRITREGKQTFDQAVVAACLAIGRPHLDSKLLSQCNIDPDD